MPGVPISRLESEWGGIDCLSANHGPRAMEPAAQNSPCGIEIQIWRTGEAGMSRAVEQVVLLALGEKGDGFRCVAPIPQLTR